MKKKPAGGSKAATASQAERAVEAGTEPRPGRAWRLVMGVREALSQRATWLVVLGGVLGALSFDPVGVRPLIILCPLLIWLGARQMPTAGESFRRVLLGGWVFYFGTLHWLCSLYVFNPIAPLGIAALALYVALYPAMAAWVTRRWFVGATHSVQFFVFAALWLFGEWFRTLGALAMPLAQLGHAWAPVPGLIQVAAWLGEPGVSACVLALGWSLLMFGDSWRIPQGERMRMFAHRTAPLVVVLVVMVLNTLPTMQKLPAGEKVRVALLQPNIDQMTKLASYAHPDEKVCAQLQTAMADLQEKMLTAHTPNDWDLLVMPESSYTEADFATNEPLRARISGLARRIGCDMIVGGNRDVSTPTTTEVYNSAWVVRADGTWEPRAYDKMRLVPFGESLPYFDMIPGFQENIVGIGSFNAGKELPLFDVRGRAGRMVEPLKYGILICFESTFGSMARAMALKGADFIVVQTNDAWYGESAGAAQHHHLSQLRAVESGRVVLRCANTGISSVIDARGHVVKSLPLLERGVLEQTVEIVRNGPQTVFARIGNHWLWLPLMGVLVVFVQAQKRATRRRDATEM